MRRWSSTASGIISHWCSPEERPITPERRRYRRVNGLQLPLHPQQVVGWAITVFIGSGTFAVSTPLLEPFGLQLLLSASLATIFFVHLLFHFAVLLLDPADPRVRARPTNLVIPEFDRKKHPHVIENGRCHLCNITTSGDRTKHCSICNKCVVRFDHHCKWLNNCIGGRNYPVFLACLISAILAALSVVALSFAELFLFNVHRDVARSNVTMENATSLPSTVLPIQQPPGTGTLLVILTIGTLSAIAAILLIHLCFFHGYIACLGVTTYEYVKNKRERKLEAEKTDVTSDVVVAVCPSFCARVNVPVRYRFCDTRVDASMEMDARNGRKESSSEYTVDRPGSNATTSRELKNNFRLCFTYEATSNGASIELSSRTMTLAGDNNEGKYENSSAWTGNVAVALTESPDFKSSTPSPVSCCFSIVNPISSSRLDRSKQSRSSRRCRKDSSVDAATTGVAKERRTCGTIGRIRTFLRTRFKKNGRHRSSSSSSSTNAENSDRTTKRRNKIVPSGDRNEVDSTIVAETSISPHENNNSGNERTEDQPLTSSISSISSRPPTKLPPLDLRKAKISPTDDEIVVDEINSDIPNVMSSTMATIVASPPNIPPNIPPPMRTISSSLSKRNNYQSHLRARRSSLRKRPRFKMGPRLAQSAQLSPIPESEFSKPASPRSPPQPNHFAFPPLQN